MLIEITSKRKPKHSPERSWPTVDGSTSASKYKIGIMFYLMKTDFVENLNINLV